MCVVVLCARKLKLEVRFVRISRVCSHKLLILEREREKEGWVGTSSSTKCMHIRFISGAFFTLACHARCVCVCVRVRVQKTEHGVRNTNSNFKTLSHTRCNHQFVHDSFIACVSSSCSAVMSHIHNFCFRFQMLPPSF